MHTHRGGISVNLQGRGERGDIKNMLTSPLPSVHCNQDCQQNWIQSRMWSAQQTQHSYNDTQQRNAVIQSICNLFSLGSTITGRSVFQHMHAYLVLLNNRKCYPVPLFHRRKKKKRHLKAMLCRGMSTLQSSSFLTTTKKKQKSHLRALGTVTRAPSAAWATSLPQVWACSVYRQCPIAPAGSPQFVSLPEVSLACRMICCSIPANPRRAATLKQTPPCCFTELSMSRETGGKLVWGEGTHAF